MSAINYDKGIHLYWMQIATQQRKGNSEQVISNIKERIERGTITEIQLILWEKEFQDYPHAFLETLLYFGTEID